MASRNIDWSQFTPIDEPAGGVDWSQFTPIEDEQPEPRSFFRTAMEGARRAINPLSALTEGTEIGRDLSRLAGGGAVTGTGRAVEGIERGVAEAFREPMPGRVRFLDDNDQPAPLTDRQREQVREWAGRNPAYEPSEFSQFLKRTGEGIQKDISPTMQQAMRDSELGGDILSPSTWTFGNDPSARGLLGHVAKVGGEMAPIVAAGAVPVVGTGLAVTAASGQSASGAYEDAADYVLNAPRRELEQSPRYRELIDAGLSEDAARNVLANEAGRGAMGPAAAIGGLSGAILSGAATRPLQRAITGRMGDTFRARMLGNAAEMPLEGLQEVGESVAGRFGANQSAGLDRDLTEGTFADFALGAAAAGPSAVFHSAIGGSADTAIKPQPLRDGDDLLNGGNISDAGRQSVGRIDAMTENLRGQLGGEPEGNLTDTLRAQQLAQLESDIDAAQTPEETEAAEARLAEFRQAMQQGIPEEGDIDAMLSGLVDEQDGTDQSVRDDGGDAAPTAMQLAMQEAQQRRAQRELPVQAQGGVPPEGAGSVQPTPAPANDPPEGASLRQRWNSDFDGVEQEYNALTGEFDSRGGTVLNTDLARELSPEYREDRGKSANVHEASSDFIKALYAKRLSQPTPEGKDPVVLFTAGGTGAGKTTGERVMGDALGAPEIIYDTNMNGLASSVQKVEQALAAGRDVEILYTYRDPVDALTGGALPRAMRMAGEQGTGRTVPLAEHAKTHLGAYSTIKALREKYADDGRVNIRIIDNSRGRGNAAEVDFDAIPPVEDNSGHGNQAPASQQGEHGAGHSASQRGGTLEARLQAALDAEYAAGRISAAVYKGFAGRDPAQGVTPEPAAESPGDVAGQPPVTMQNRDRSRVASVGQMQSIRNNPDPERLGFSRDPNTGAPMVSEGRAIPDADKGASDVVTGSDGRRVPVRYAVVEAGDLAASHDVDGRANPDYASAPLRALNNGRVAGIQAAWQAGNGNAYKAGLVADARLHGVSPEAIQGKQNPVLVRLYDPAENRNDMGAWSNASAQLGLSPVEQAQTDARALPSLDAIEWSADGSLSPTSNVDFFRAWFRNLGAAQSATLQDAQGRPNAAAIQRVRAALVQRAYGDERLLTALAEEVNPDQRNVMHALVRAAPAFAALDQSDPLAQDIRSRTTEALETVRKAAREGQAVDVALAQGDMLGRSPEADAIARFMALNARSVSRMADAFRAMAEYAAQAQSQAATVDIFGNAPTPSVRAALEAANEALRENHGEQYRIGLPEEYDSGAAESGNRVGERAAGYGAAPGEAGGTGAVREGEGSARQGQPESLTLSSPASAPAASNTPAPSQSGLFAPPTRGEVLDAEIARRDAERNGRAGTGRTDMLSGDGELFAGPRPEQAEIENAEQARTPPEGPYTADLFGSPLPDSGGTDRANGPARSRVRGDVQPASPVLGDTPTPAGEYTVRTVVGTETRRKLGASRIRSFADLAQATQYLYRSAVERFDGIVTDANGKPLAVVGGFKGELAGATIPPPVLIAEIVRVPGAAQVWFSHNHPSGQSELSRADRVLADKLESDLRGSGIESMGLIAVGDGEYTATDGSGGKVPAADSGVTVPVVEREQVRDNVERESITSPALAMTIGRAAHDRAGGPGVLLMDTRHEVIGWMPIPDAMLGDLRGTGQLNAIYRSVSEGNVAAAILVHAGELDADHPSSRAVTVGQNIAAALNIAGVRPLDSINVKTNVSMAERGRSIDAGPVFSRRQSPARRSASFNESAYRPAVVSWARARFGDTVAENGRPVWQNFTEWFGDSQVVDADGRPLAVYHGTSSDVTEFSIDALGTGMGNTGYYGAGHYFTEDAEQAGRYASAANIRAVGEAGPSVMPAYLSIQNPLEIHSGRHAAPAARERSRRTLGRLIEQLVADRRFGPRPDANEAGSRYASVMQMLERGDFDQVMSYLFADLDGGRGITYYAKRAGFDGAIVTRNPQDGPSIMDEVVAFESTQIKSATGNQGTFDASTGDIRLARGQSPARRGTPLGEGKNRAIEAIAVRVAGVNSVGRRLVNVVDGAAGLPAEVRQHMADEGVPAEEVRGVHWKGRTWLVAENLHSVQDVEETLFHEHYGHFGLRAKYGAKLGGELRNLLESIGGLNGLRSLAKEQGIDLSHYEATLAASKSIPNIHKRLILMEELMAHVAETTGTLRRTIEEWVGKVRDWLRTRGFAELAEYGITDLAYVLREARQAAMEKAEGGDARRPFFQRVFHGTPYRGIEKEGFKLNKIGTGEGAQAYGWGIYFAGRRAVAETYRDTLSRSRMLKDGKPVTDSYFDLSEAEKRRRDAATLAIEFHRITPKEHADNLFRDGLITERERDAISAYSTVDGQLYAAEIPEDSDLLDYDAPLSEQPEKVRAALEPEVANLRARALEQEAGWGEMAAPDRVEENITGQFIYRVLADALGPQGASQRLMELGIPGLRYLDGSSRDGRGDSANYVIWDESLLTPEAAEITPYYSRRSGDAPENEVAYRHGEEELASRLVRSGLAQEGEADGRRGVGLVPSQWAEPSAYSDVRRGEGAFVLEFASREEARAEAERLIATARREGFFWDDGAQARVAELAWNDSSGAEHDVHFVGSGNDRLAIRSTANGIYGNRADITPAMYLQRLQEYNQIFPHLQMRLIGVSEDPDGNAVLWTAQKFVEGREFDSDAELAAAMAEQGWDQDGDDPRFIHRETGAIIEDAHSGNILHADGELFPIDVHVEKLPARGTTAAVPATVESEPSAPYSPGAMFSRRAPSATAAPPATRSSTAGLGTQLVNKLHADILPRMGRPGDFISEQLDDGFERDWVDEFVDLRRAEEATARRLGVKPEDLPDHMQARRQETLRHGAYQDRLRTAERDYFEPVAKILGDADLDRDGFADYLWWRHAGERDAYLRAKHAGTPGAADLAGIDPKEAAQNIANLPAKTRRAYEKAAAHIDQLRQHTLDVLVDSGQIPESTRDALLARWQHYVPLRGLPAGMDDPIIASFNGGGKGLSVARNPLGKKALGRKSKPQDILEQMHLDLERALIGAEKQKVLKSIIGLIHANPDIGKVDPVKTEKREVNGVIQHVMTSGDHTTQLTYLHHGRPVKIELANQHLTQAALNMNEPLPKALRNLAKVTRWLSAVKTAYSPYFMLINPARDAEFAALGVAVERGSDVFKSAAKFYPHTFGALRRDRHGKPLNKDIDRYAREFAKVGGKTGYTFVNDITELRNGLNRMFAKERKGLTPGKAWRAVNDMVEAANEYAENSARLAVFAALREHGVTAEQAGKYAKEVTVNFNTKGRLGKKANAFYMFFNAAVQGTRRVHGLAKNRAFRYAMIGLTGTSYALALAQMIAMGDDDDDESLYLKKIKDSDRLRSLPISVGDEEWLSVPVPYGPNFFNYLGSKMAEITYEQMRGRKVDPAKIAGQVFSAASQSFSPIDVSEGLDAVTPELGRIIWNTFRNRDDWGRPLNYTQYYNTDENRPMFAEGSVTTGDAFKVFARVINRITGGSDYEAGGINLSPEQARYVTQQALGGMYRLGSESYELLEKMLTDDKITAQDVPLSNVFLRSRPVERQQSEGFYENRDLVNDLRRQFKAAHERQDQPKIDNLLSEHPWLRGAQLDANSRAGKAAQARTPVGALRRTEREIRKLRVTREAAYMRVGRFEGLTVAESRAKMREIDREIAELQKQFNATVNRAQ